MHPSHASWRLVVVPPSVCSVLCVAAMGYPCGCPLAVCQFVSACSAAEPPTPPPLPQTLLEARRTVSVEVCFCVNVTAYVSSLAAFILWECCLFFTLIQALKLVEAMVDRCDSTVRPYFFMPCLCTLEFPCRFQCFSHALSSHSQPRRRLRVW